MKQVAKQDWSQRVSEEIRENSEIIKEAQRYYYELREKGLSHPQAIAVLTKDLITFLTR